MDNIPSELFIHIKQYNKLEDKALDWILKAYNFKQGSYDFLICMLFAKKTKEEALDHFYKAKNLLDKYE